MSDQQFPKHKNVFRIVTGNTVGWQVRIERRKKQYSKLFSDSLYDGTEGALNAALEWRDNMLAQLPPDTRTARHLHTARNKRRSAEAVNRTGVIGIGFSMQTQKDGMRAPYVSCHWRDPESGRRRASSYSIQKHGIRGALDKACRRLRVGKGDKDVTDSQVRYMVRKALPQVKDLYVDAMETQGLEPERSVINR